jgi:hypothetical protein
MLTCMREGPQVETPKLPVQFSCWQDIQQNHHIYFHLSTEQDFGVALWIHDQFLHNNIYTNIHNVISLPSIAFM